MHYGQLRERALAPLSRKHNSPPSARLAGVPINPLEFGDSHRSKINGFLNRIQCFNKQVIFRPTSTKIEAHIVPINNKGVEQ